MIRTEGLTKVYDGVKAVDSIDLSVSKGEVFGFLGPNGAGKTTTIGMLVGLIEPSAGKCFINGIEVARNPLEIKRITGYLPDGVGFYPHLSSTQNLKYFSKFYRMKDADSERRIKELLEYVGLGGIEKPVGSYSKGMKQRLGLAQAMLNDPEVIFLDEPTAGLDPQGVIQFRNIIKEQASKGKTVFFSSHILNEVQNVCETIGIISKGVMLAQGTKEDIKRKMSKDNNVTIIVKVIGDMPKLSSPGIIDAKYSNGSATILAESDIRDGISEELFGKGHKIRELRVQERSLEEIFLDTVYRSDPHEK
jgi:ABC-2 type transport system ATP-binding protein